MPETSPAAAPEGRPAVAFRTKPGNLALDLTGRPGRLQAGTGPGEETEPSPRQRARRLLGRAARKAGLRK